MADPDQRALAHRAESLRTELPGAAIRDAPVGVAEQCAASSATLAWFAAIRDDELDEAVLDPEPERRLAACWRLMLHEQALPRTAPTDGVRLLLVVNLASVQHVDALDTLVRFDPCPAVRATAATHLWRIARDRDRVVDLLLARLDVERAPLVLAELLGLTPALPVTRILPTLRVHADHHLPEVRVAAENLWRATVGAPLPPYRERRAAHVRAAAEGLWRANQADDAELARAIQSEDDTEVRIALLERWASSDGHRRMLPWLAHPRMRDAGIAALAASDRRYPFEDPEHLVDVGREDALRLVGAPFSERARRGLLALTGALDPDRTPTAPTDLLRCLAAAYATVVPTAEESAVLDALRARRDGLMVRLRAVLDAEAEDVDEYEAYSAEEDEDVLAMREQAFVLTDLIDASSGSTRTA